MKGRIWFGVAALVLFLGLAGSAGATVITFDEQVSQASGLAGMNNYYLISSDGQFKVEGYWYDPNSGWVNSGHLHNSDGSWPVIGAHMNGSTQMHAQDFQGLYITKVDGGLFDLDGMDLLSGGVAIGTVGDFSNAASWDAYITASTLDFAGLYDNVSGIFLEDGTSFTGAGMSYWDNIVLNGTVPEPATMLLFGTGLIGLAASGIRRKKSA